jgi:hypothetical protein
VSSNRVEFELEKKSASNFGIEFQTKNEFKLTGRTELFVNFKRVEPEFEKRICVELYPNFKLNQFLSSRIQINSTQLYSFAILSRAEHRSVTAGFGPKNSKPTITIEAKIPPITDRLLARFCRVADRSGVGLIGRIYSVNTRSFDASIQRDE